MVAQVTQSQVLARIKQKAKGGWEKAREVEAMPSGFIELPGGIIGIGKVTSAKLALAEAKDAKKTLYEQVQLRFMVCEPIEYAGVSQFKSYSFRETEKKSYTDCLADFANDAQLLGVTTAGTDIDDLSTMLESLETDKPYFKFSTRRSEKTDEFDARTWISVVGCTQYDGPDPEPTVINGPAKTVTGTEPEVIAESEPEAPKSPPKTSPKSPPKSPPKKVPEPEPEPEPVVDDMVPEEVIPTKEPEVGDRCWVVIKNVALASTIDKADLAAGKFVCKVDTTEETPDIPAEYSGKSFTITKAQLEKWNPA